MELVDPSLPQSNPLSTFLIRLHDNYTETFKPPLKGEGWGSQEATKMVLNNLFYITVKVSIVLSGSFNNCMLLIIKIFMLIIYSSYKMYSLNLFILAQL